MSQRARRAQQQLRRRSQIRVAGLVALAAVAAVVVVAVASSLADGDGGGSQATPTLQVSMTEFAFDPDPIVLPAGNGAVLEVVNDGSVAHDLVINQLGKGTPDLAPGQRMVLDLSGQPAGTYRVVCDLPGHTEAGMVTQITLE